MVSAVVGVTLGGGGSVGDGGVGDAGGGGLTSCYCYELPLESCTFKFMMPFRYLYRAKGKGRLFGFPQKSSKKGFWITHS